MKKHKPLVGTNVDEGVLVALKVVEARTGVRRSDALRELITAYLEANGAPVQMPEERKTVQSVTIRGR